jgi:3-hydroxyisobutyrate dehydrogenase-like beta-hydroxyacid dehydrogenase
MQGTNFIADKDEAIDVIDAPVACGAEQASRGILTMPAGGEAMVVQRCWLVRAAFDKNLLHLRPSGV